jgi:tryptophan halogenase
MTVPDSLQHRLDLFREGGHAFQAPGELFQVDSWLQVMLGQRLEPERHHLMAALMSPDKLRSALADLKAGVARSVSRLPPHQEFLDAYVGAAAEAMPA